MSEPTAVPEGGTCGCETVCSLPAEQIAARAVQLRADFLPFVRGHEASATTVVWHFEDTEGMRARLDELVEFERQCCVTLDFEVAAAADANELRFTVTGPGADLFTLGGDSRGSADAPARSATAVATAGGVGLALSLVLCCALPMAIAALGGAVVVAPFTKLDSPLYIGAGTILIAIPVWLRMRRNAAQKCGC